MTIADRDNRNLPERYYSTMYMDGFTPEQILMTARQTFMSDAEESQEEVSIDNVHITSEVKIKK